MLYVGVRSWKCLRRLLSLSMKIAILGTRGIPNRYGGFEAFAEQISRRLAEHGHEVTVYCRRPFTRPEDDRSVDARIRRVILPGISHKHLDTAFNGFISSLHVLGSKADVLLYCNVANAPVVWIPRLFGKPVVLNVDGLDRKRRKWGWLASTYLHLCEVASVATPSKIVTDSGVMQRYYKERYGRATTMIGYGADAPAAEGASRELLARLGLQEKKFVLYVSRLEPENHPELVIRAYNQTQAEWPLVMVGESRYDTEYEERLRALAGPGIRMAGAIYGPGYWQLQRSAGLFIFACEVGGIHPALIETMAVGNAALYLDTESNRETAGDCGVPFQPDESELAAKLTALTGDAARREQLGRAAAERARKLYSWEAVTKQYEELFRQLTGKEKE